MSQDLVKHGPNLIHPETASAVGSRNSLFRDKRDEYVEGRLLVDEEVDKILNHIHAKLPPEALSRMEVMGSVKSKLHSYFNQGMANMTNRYLTTMEDELSKKVRNLIDTEEMRGLNRYMPRSVSYLLDRIAGADKFNTGEVEKSIINMYGHLHGHVQREMNDLETNTNSLLRRKTDVGAFVRGENAYSIAKCSFRDHREKPETVMEVKLALNILDSELISPLYPYQTEMEKIVKDIIGKQIQDALDKELDNLNASMVDEGKPELSHEERIFERIKALDNHISDDEAEGSKRYTHISKRVLDAVEGLKADLDFSDYDPLRIREATHKLVADENIRNRGYNTSVNALTHVLDWSRMGYQHIENYKGLRELIIREYADTEESVLPDERYEIRLKHLNADQLREARLAFQVQLDEIQRAIMEVWEVVEKIYMEDRSAKRKDDWDTISERILTAKPKRSFFGLFNFGGAEEEEEEIGEEGEKTAEAAVGWNEISFISPEEKGILEQNPTRVNLFSELKERFPLMREKLHGVFQDATPELREIMDGRIDFLEKEFNRFSMLVNPYHVQPGLILEVNITSIKRKSTTMMSMANVLNEFLSSVSKGFQDKAFADFSRRRSTQRADIAEGFGSAAEMADDEMHHAGAQGHSGHEVFD